MGIKVKGQEQPEFTPMEPGEYKAFVKELQEELEGQYGPQVRFEFEIIDDEDYAGDTIRGWASLKIDDDGDYTFWEGTKLWEWVTALRGGEVVGVSEEFELEDLVGEPCRIMVVAATKQDGTPKDKINAVLPPKKGKAAGSKKKEVAMEEEEDFDQLTF